MLGVASFFGLGSEDAQVPTFWVLLYGPKRLAISTAQEASVLKQGRSTLEPWAKLLQTDCAALMWDPQKVQWHTFLLRWFLGPVVLP